MTWPINGLHVAPPLFLKDSQAMYTACNFCQPTKWNPECAASFLINSKLADCNQMNKSEQFFIA